jgi:hypothetical protein
MTRRTPLFLILALAVAILAAVPAAAATLAPNVVLKLPSGHLAKILSISKIEYAKGVMALMVRYQTSLSMDEAKDVAQEVDEVWKFAQKDVERAGYREAIISSRQTVRGLLLTTSREANFIFEKGADGNWTRLQRGDFMALE